MVLGLNADDIQRNYNLWGPSARTCLQLSRSPDREDKHEADVSLAASALIANPYALVNVLQVDPMKASHVLFCINPRDQTSRGRMIPVAEFPTNRIKEIISYTMAKVTSENRILFYQTISSQPLFKASTGQMFERFVLSWLASLPKDSLSLHCTLRTPRTPPPQSSRILRSHSSRTPVTDSATPPPTLKIFACGEENTFFFGSSTALKQKVASTMNSTPLCLLPTSQTFAAVDAIVLTEQNIITVQVTISDNHSAKKEGFEEIKKSLPHEMIMKRPWLHVFITDDHDKAESLRNQTLSDLPNNISIYSAVFNVGDIKSIYMDRFDAKMVSGSWLHAIQRLVLIGVLTSNLNMRETFGNWGLKTKTSAPCGDGPIMIHPFVSYFVQ